MKYIKREFEEDILKWIDHKEIIAIRGPRQCGKTTFLKRIIEVLLERKINKENIHFISFEDDFEVEKIEKNPLEYIRFHAGEIKTKHFFILDEVQYIKCAGKILKLIYDSLENIKIIVTGSSTLDLNEIGSFLVGRVLLFEMYPFSFQEFLESKDLKLYNYYTSKKLDINKKITPLEILYLDELNKQLIEYLTYGGYPAVVMEKNIENKKILLKNLFLTYIEKDIVKIYGSKYRQRISELIKYLSTINTSILNYNEISSVVGLYDKEVKEILRILEDSYIIKLIKPFHRNLTTELKKNPKVYFIDIGLRNFISGRFDFSNEELGKIFENYVLLKFRQSKINYWRTTAKAEVDFVIDEKIPVESKINPKITRSLRSFINAYNPKHALLIDLKGFSKSKINSTDIFIIPGCIL